MTYFQMEQLMFAYVVMADSSNTNQILILIGTIVLAVGTYAGIRYGKSGQIRRTEAEKLWDERTELSKEMRNEINELKEEARLQAEEITRLKNENWDYKQQLVDLTRKLEDLTRRLSIIEGRS